MLLSPRVANPLNRQISMLAIDREVYGYSIELKNYRTEARLDN